jgi:hypothetical protein
VPLNSFVAAAGARTLATTKVDSENFLVRSLAQAAIAEADRIAGRLEDAEHGARSLLEKTSRLSVVHFNALATLASIAVARKRWDEALDLTERSALLHQRTAIPRAESELRLLRALALRALGRADAARVAIREARERILRIAATFDDPQTRETYLSVVEPNSRTLELARELLGEEHETRDAGSTILNVR